MVSSLVVIATLLSAEPADFHFGGTAGLGAAVPFKTANAGFQLSVKGFIDFPVAKRFVVGGVLPLGLGFVSSTSAFGGLFATASYTLVDVMPGVRGMVSVLDWVRAGVELGLGPAIQYTRVSTNVPTFGPADDTRTAFAMRGAFFVEVQPEALPGVLFYVEPVAFHGRFSDQHFSEYRFSIGAGYRR